MDLDKLESLVNDITVVSYLKRNNLFGVHGTRMRQEALERIFDHGGALVKEEVTNREYARLKQMVLDFEIANGIK